MNSFLIILPTKIAKFWLICVAPPLKIVKRTKCVHRLQTVYANMHVKNSICPCVRYKLLEIHSVRSRGLY